MIDLSRAIVLDLETSGEKAHGRISNCFLEGGEVNVYAEYRGSGRPSIVYDYDQDIRPFLSIDLEGIDWIIGQNIKFDMGWLWHHPQIQAFFARGGKLYDTMIAEYFLLGHDTRAWKNKKLGLDALVEKYGGEKKLDKIKEYWEQGLSTKDIGRMHHDDLMYYASWDVMNLWPIAKQQIQFMKMNGMLNAFTIYMEHLAAVCEYEDNGMKIDQELGAIREAEVEGLINPLSERMQELVRPFWPEQIEFNRASGKMLSAALFGGECGKYSIDEPVLDELGMPIKYKGGKRKGEVKTKKAPKIAYAKGFGLPPTGFKANANGYSVDKERLPTLLKIEHPDNGWREFVECLLEIRKHAKVLDNYYRGKKGVLRNTYPDGYVHPNFYHTSTATGRLSCGWPNAQNTDKATKELVVSRWGDEGVIVSIDYSGQEIVVEASMAGCRQKLQDVADGLDEHLFNAASAANADYEEWKVRYDAGDKELKELRTKAKTFSFGDNYGEGEAQLAFKMGLPVETVAKMKQGKKDRYPEIYLHHDIILEDLKRSEEPSDDLMPIQPSKKRSNKPLPDGFYWKKEHEVAGKFTIRNNEYRLSYGYHSSIFGQRWKYPKYGALTQRNEVFEYFSGPMIQNYYVQGTSALCTKLAAGQLFYKYAQFNRDTMRIINEIHDEVLFDIKKDHLDFHLPKICSIMEGIQDELIERYNLKKFDLPLKVDYSYGNSWLEAKENE